MAVELGSEDSTGMRIGNKTVRAGYIGNKLVFGTASNNVTLSGSIACGNSNTTCTSSFSVTGAAGGTGSINVVISPNTGYEFSSLPTVTFTGLGSSLTAGTCTLSEGSVTCPVSYTIPSANETDNFTVTAAPSASLSNFTSSNWTGSVSVNAAGTVSATSGNVTSVSIISETCGSNSSSCSSASCSAVIQLTGIPSGYANSGASKSITFTRNLTQPAGRGNLDTSSEWTGSVSFSSSGTAIISSGNMTSVSTNPSSFSSNSGCSSLTRTVTVSGTVSDVNYCNNGSSTSFSETTTQSASGTNWTSNLVTGPTINVYGTVSGIDYGGLTSNSISYNTSVRDNSCDTCCSSRTYTWTISGTIPSGYCNSGSTTTVTGTTTQASGGNNLDSYSEWDGSITVAANGNVTTNEGSLLSNVVVSAKSPCTGAYNSNAGTDTLSCPSNSSCSSVVRAFVITGDVEPDNSTYCNAGDATTINANRSQPASQSQFAASSVCSSISISNTGAISKPNYVTVSPTSFATVKTATSRSISISGTVPNSFCNGGDSFSGTCTVTQPASVAATISASPSSFTFDGTGEDIGSTNGVSTITIQGATDYTVSDNRSWITTSKSGTSLTISVSSYSGGSSRLGTVTVRNGSDSSVTASISVRQVGEV